MTNTKIFVFVAYAVLAAAGEAEDVEQKKRGMSKTNNSNNVLTGAQKDYTYSIYNQNPQVTSHTYSENRPHSSFYPSQNTPTDYYYSSQNLPETVMQAHSQSSSTSSQFVPISVINHDYQSKYQTIPSKSSNAHIQLSVIPQSPVIQPPIVPYPQSFFTPNSQLNPPSIIHQPFNSNYQYSPAMLLIPQIQPLSNYLYPSSAQQLYYQNQPSKYNFVLQSPFSPHQEYEKAPVIKEDNDYLSKGVNSYQS